MGILPPIVGSLFSWKSLLTKRRTSEDCKRRNFGQQLTHIERNIEGRTLPTAASPKSTSLTLLLGFGAFAPACSDMAEIEGRVRGN